MTDFPKRRLSAAVAGLMTVSLWVSCGGGPVDREPALPEFISARYWREKIGSVVLPLIAEHDTELAPGYREDAFDSLRLGASREDVEELLGAPIKTWRFSGGEVWSYSRAGSKGGFYFERIVRFDSTGTLTRKRQASYMD